MKLLIRPCTNFFKCSNRFLFTSLFAFLFTFNRAAAQSCDPNGNLIIFSNYDGGELNINVDVDIADLRIGICSYEPVRITISGPFSGNVTEVLYAGANSTQNNNNCNIGNFPTSISGVPASNYTIQTAPPVTVTNPNGNNGGIICGYSCDLNSDQGGCNTINQVVDYFNVFSPNSDGINDTFYPFATCPFESYEFLIFDRWGALVFKSNNPQDRWNGTFNNKACSSDTYLYTMSYQFVSQPINRISGSVSLLR